MFRSLFLSIFISLFVQSLVSSFAFADITEIVVYDPDAPGSVINGPTPDGKWRSGCDSSMRCFFTFPISVTANPQKVNKVIMDCVNNNACVAVLNLVSAELGVPPGEIAAVAKLYGTATQFENIQNAGNEHTLGFDLPSGLYACTMYWNFYSHVGGSTISGSFARDRHQVGFYLNVPVQNFLAGRSWMNGFVEVYAHSSKTDSGCYHPDPNNNTGMNKPVEWSSGFTVFNTNGGDTDHGGNVVGQFYLH